MSPFGKLSWKRESDSLTSTRKLGENVCVKSWLAMSSWRMLLMLPFSAGGGKKSEERRVGEEGRFWGGPDYLKKKNKARKIYGSGGSGGRPATATDPEGPGA